MKTLKEQILKKIVKKAFNSGLNAEADESFLFSANADKYWNEHKFEIESLIKENYVEKEFVEWIIFSNDSPFWYEIKEGEKVYFNDNDARYYDIKYVHNFWLNNIKDK